MIIAVITSKFIFKFKNLPKLETDIVPQLSSNNNEEMIEKDKIIGYYENIISQHNDQND